MIVVVEISVKVLDNDGYHRHTNASSTTIKGCVIKSGSINQAVSGAEIYLRDRLPLQDEKEI